MLRRTILFKIILLGIFTSSFIYAVTKITEPKIEKFVDKMVKEHKFDDKELRKLLLNASYQDEVINAIKKPAEKLPWYKYKQIFLKPNRIDGGVKFWQENKAALDRAYKEYGVPPEIVTALIGVETLYGQYKGKYPVLDSLATLSFYYKPRSRFFTSELEQFLLYTREEKTDPTKYYGSYAGAMGYPQFISSSIRRYAVDFTDDGHRDLHNNINDAIGSVANYINKNGWQKDQPITTKATVIGNLFKQKPVAQYINKLKPNLSVQALKKNGVTTQQPFTAELAANLLEFDANGSKSNNKEYWVGFNNFYVITRYNISQNYAMAVYLLSERIKEEYNKQLKTPKQETV